MNPDCIRPCPPFICSDGLDQFGLYLDISGLYPLISVFCKSTALLKISDKFRIPKRFDSQSGVCPPNFIRSCPKLVRFTSSKLESEFHQVLSDICTIRRTLPIQIGR